MGCCTLAFVANDPKSALGFTWSAASPLLPREVTRDAHDVLAHELERVVFAERVLPDELERGSAELKGQLSSLQVRPSPEELTSHHFWDRGK